LFADSGHTFQEVLDAMDAEQAVAAFCAGGKSETRLSNEKVEVKSENCGCAGRRDAACAKSTWWSAALDHLGIGAPVNGDKIYTGDG